MTAGRVRKWLWQRLDPEARPDAGLSFMNKLLFVAVGLSISFGIAETEQTVTEFVGPLLDRLDRLLLYVFTVEYFGRVWVCGLNPQFRGFSGLLRFHRLPSTILDLVVIAPMYFIAPVSWITILRLARVLRILKFARIPQISRAMKDFSAALHDRRFELYISLGVTAFVLLIASTLLYLAEGASQPEDFGSIPRAFWWGVATLTTVGYGDVTPITPLGRLLASVFAFAGIGVTAMLTGIFAAALMDVARER